MRKPMIAIKAHYDGEKVVLPEDLQGVPPGEVILVFEHGQGTVGEIEAWMKASEEAFAKAWDNEEDAVYDSL